jgi:hypothetical protein
MNIGAMIHNHLWNEIQQDMLNQTNSMVCYNYKMSFSNGALSIICNNVYGNTSKNVYGNIGSDIQQKLRFTVERNSIDFL